MPLGASFHLCLFISSVLLANYANPYPSNTRTSNNFLPPL
jgi:hypothetical protein